MEGCELNGRSDSRAIFPDVFVPVSVGGQVEFIHPVSWMSVTKSILNVKILSLSKLLHMYVYIYMYVHHCKCAFSAHWTIFHKAFLEEAASLYSVWIQLFTDTCILGHLMGKFSLLLLFSKNKKKSRLPRCALLMGFESLWKDGRNFLLHSGHRGRAGKIVSVVGICLISKTTEGVLILYRCMHSFYIGTTVSFLKTG